ncbi:Syntaxin-5 [Schistosoma japonicum]|nr:Syntaxin-5 [Schistosoma japonicum]KAH8868080.1 Syntaxin-5 [Schistosoma japonicum]KAH8868081.1 Syntaxin-5 [Schistosoma japonicum]KAH8868082.1 Syntaxin-5 [Schistosoma japonicum]KAH8868083.1 Syntaxin-5 [Schistosoma japonicum]
MSGALDRTGEFRACTQSFHDRLLSGRLRLKPPHHKNLHSVDTRHTADFLAKSKQMSNELKMTVSKMTKLKLLFQDASNSSPEVLSKLIEVIQYDIMDLNKAKFQLKASLSEVKEHSVTSVQHLKHIDLIVIGLEYYLSSLVSEFRALLEKHKAYLSADSKKSDVDTRLNCNPNQLTKSASLSGISISNLQSSINPTSNAYMSTAHSVKDHLQVNNHQHSNGLFNPTLSSIAHVSSSYSSNLPTVTPIAELNGAPTVSRSEFYNSSQSGTTYQAVEQLQLFDRNQHVPLIDQEVRQRDAAIRRVESTIVQLGEIYQQFSSLVQEQNDLVLRIDTQTDNAEININEAHAQLLVFMRRISAQRGFLIKVFVTIILCFIVFAWIVK